jgi:hypothetical protein
MAVTLTEWMTESAQRIPEHLQARLRRGNWIAAYRIVDGVRGKAVLDVSEALKDIHPHLNPQPSFLLEYDEQGEKHGPEEQSSPPALQFSVLAPMMCFYWRASPDGEFFITSTFHDDEQANARTSILDLLSPTWVTHECLLHAGALASRLHAGAGSIQFRMEWHGLRDRQLMRGFNTSGSPAAEDDAPPATIEVSAYDIRATTTKYVHELTVNLYNVFGKQFDETRIAEWMRENPRYRHG